MKAPRKVRKTIRKKRSRVPRSKAVKSEPFMEKHHRLPRSRGGSSSAHNIGIIERKVHRAWHYLVGNANAKEAAGILSALIDPRYYFIAMPRHRKVADCRRTRCMCTDCGAEVLKVLPKTSKKSRKTPCKK